MIDSSDHEYAADNNIRTIHLSESFKIYEKLKSTACTVLFSLNFYQIIN